MKYRRLKWKPFGIDALIYTPIKPTGWYCRARRWPRNIDLLVSLGAHVLLIVVPL